MSLDPRNYTSSYLRIRVLSRWDSRKERGCGKQERRCERRCSEMYWKQERGPRLLSSFQRTERRNMAPPSLWPSPEIDQRLVNLQLILRDDFRKIQQFNSVI